MANNNGLKMETGKVKFVEDFVGTVLEGGPNLTSEELNELEELLKQPDAAETFIGSLVHISDGH